MHFFQVNGAKISKRYVGRYNALVVTECGNRRATNVMNQTIFIDDPKIFIDDFVFLLCTLEKKVLRKIAIGCVNIFLCRAK
jgi:hypothetical protein